MIGGTEITSDGTINKTMLDKLSAIEVRDGCTLKLFNDSNMDTPLTTFTGYTPWMEDDYNENTLSYNCQCDGTIILNWLPIICIILLLLEKKIT